MANKVGEIFVRLFVKDETEKGLKEAEKNMTKVGDKVGTVGKTFTVVGGAIAGALGLAVKTSMDFEAQMSRVGAISGATGSEMEKLRQSALDLGASTSLSASQVAQAQEEMAKMGFKTNEILAAMPGTINAAVASGENLALVSETMASALRTFNLDAGQASHVADVLAQAANDSSAGVEDMSYAFRYAAAPAAQLGMSLEELSAAVEVMANQGIKGETAGTTLRSVLFTLAAPTKKQTKLMEELGLQTKNSHGAMLPFSQIIGQLQQKLHGMSQTERAAALEHLFGKEAVTGLMTIMNSGAATLDKLTNKLKHSGGASDEAAAKMKNNLKGAVEQLKGSFETAGISIGGALTPALEKVASFVTNLVNGFNKLSGPSKQFIAIGAAVAAVLFLLAGAALMAAPGLVALATAEWAAIAPVLLMAGAILLVAAVIVGLAYVIVTYWSQIKAFTINVWNTVKNWLVSTWNSIGTALTNAWNGLKNFVTSLWNGIVNGIINAWNTLKGWITGAVNAVKNAVVGAFQWMYNHNYYFKDLVDFIVRWWNVAKSITSSVWNAVKSFLSSVWNWIKSVATSVFSSVSSFLSGIWNSIKSTSSSTWNSIKSAISSAWNSIKSSVMSGVNYISNLLGGLADKALTWAGNMMDMFISGIKSRISRITSAISGVADKIAKLLGFHSPTPEGPASDSDQWMKNMMNMFTNDINDHLPKLQGAVYKVAASLNPGQISMPQSQSASNGPTVIINGAKDSHDTADKFVRAWGQLQFLGRA